MIKFSAGKGLPAKACLSRNARVGKDQQANESMASASCSNTKLQRLSENGLDG
jgi:hypothetical protein